MKHLVTTLSLLAASPAWADSSPATTPGTPPQANGIAPADGTPAPADSTSPPADGALPADGTAAPAVAPPPVAPAPVAPPPAVAVAPPPPPADKPFVDDYYDRKRGIGMFHQARLAIGVLNGTAPKLAGDMMMPVTPGETTGVTQGEIAFEGVYLGLPSAYGHFHGIEVSTGLRSTPIDYWLQFGTAVSLFNLGRGGPGSLRVGGSFGAGFNLAHGYGYVRGRAALVILPAKLDAEVSATWTPNSASTGNYDEVLYRASVWFRPGAPGGSKRAYEVYVESLRRSDDAEDKEREFTGIGGGIGMTFF